MLKEIEDFLSHLKVVRRLSAHTQNAYRRDLEKLQNWSKEQGILDLGALQHAHLRLFVSFLHRKRLSGRSIQRHLSAIRSLFSYLIKQGRLEHNPCQDIPVPKADKKLPKVLNIDQVSHLLEGDTGDWHEIRDNAMFELFYSSGLRLSELVSLNINQLNLKDGWVQVIGKGNKERTLPVGSKAIEAIKEWLAFRADFLPDSSQGQESSGEDNAQGSALCDALFISQLGRRISVRNVQTRLKKMALEKGILTDVSPHTLRHTFASHMLENSQNLRVVQELLGHADISTTQVYTHLDFKHLAEVYDAAHPRARRRSGRN